MKVVRFADGTYGVRRWSLLELCYLYLDFKDGVWWPRSSRWFHDCRGTEEEARLRADKGTQVI